VPRRKLPSPPPCGGTARLPLRSFRPEAQLTARSLPGLPPAYFRTFTMATNFPAGGKRPYVSSQASAPLGGSACLLLPRSFRSEVQLTTRSLPGSPPAYFRTFTPAY
jgi:hypothetical protein